MSRRLLLAFLVLAVGLAVTPTAEASRPCLQLQGTANDLQPVVIRHNTTCRRAVRVYEAVVGETGKRSCIYYDSGAKRIGRPCRRYGFTCTGNRPSRREQKLTVRCASRRYFLRFLY